MSWEHLENDKAVREKIAQSACVICNKTIGPGGYTGSSGRYAHIECGSSKDTRELRACTGCGHVRRVKVTRNPFSNLELVEPHCAACKLEASARRHVEQAQKLAAAARKIRARRAK